MKKEKQGIKSPACKPYFTSLYVKGKGMQTVGQNKKQKISERRTTDRQQRAGGYLLSAGRKVPQPARTDPIERGDKSYCDHGTCQKT